MARRKAQNPYGSCLAARGRLAARQALSSERSALICGVPATGPAFVRSVARECADRSVSQLLAGTPSGPGGSSNAARVPRCERPAGAAPRPASRRLKKRPSNGRGEGMIREVQERGQAGRYSRRKSHLAGVYHRHAPKRLRPQALLPGPRAWQRAVPLRIEQGLLPTRAGALASKRKGRLKRRQNRGQATRNAWESPSVGGTIAPADYQCVENSNKSEE